MGLDEAPEDGAVLQLKTQANASSGGVNSSQGLLLPRVQLKSLIISSGSNLATTIEGTEASDNWDKDTHVGLVVYHIKGSTTIESGIYVWNKDTDYKWLAVRMTP
ncbi:MAG: hypothetical protein E6767_14170 [Dysgonomonas sp.]|nr:hypothetical protein [Dysgonomonas sp.]